MRSCNVLQRGLVELHRARHNVRRLRHKAAPGHPSPYTSELLSRVLKAHGKVLTAEGVYGTHLLSQIRAAEGRTWNRPLGKITENFAGLLDAVGDVIYRAVDAQDRIARALSAVGEVENAIAEQEGMNALEPAPQ